MRNLYIFLFISFVAGSLAYSQEMPNVSTVDQSILLSITTSTQPKPTIMVNWKKHPYASTYNVRRKLASDFSASAWKLLAANLDSLKTSYVDTTVKVGVEYEYEVYGSAIEKYGSAPNGWKFYAFGYIGAAIEAPEKDDMGDVLLVVDSTLYDGIKPSLDLYSEQLKKEGWRVLPYYLAPRAEAFDKDKVAFVKNRIYGIATDTNYRLRTVTLIGRIPVPYSGDIAPDAHGNHYGAWPADGYYGVLNKTPWPDNTVNVDSASDVNNHNVPGDGKFDISTFIGANNQVKIQIGRIDFYNLPKFKKSETQLIEEYLKKDLDYRQGKTAYITRGLVDDNFGAYGIPEGFATSGWRNFGALCGQDSVKEIDFFESLGLDNYLWSYGCGGGWPEGAGGVGNTDDMVTKPVKGIFTFLFGSYFGDWNQQNNFIRSAIASQPSVLTCAWAGRPQWYVHRMGLGYNIGESTVISQNNTDFYKNNVIWLNSSQSVIYTFGTAGVHTALIGDPTLKMFAGRTPSPSSLTLNRIGDGIIEINWTQDGDGETPSYNVYRAKSPEGPYEKLNKARINGFQFIDTTNLQGQVYYAVSASNLITNNSGTIWNSGERIFGQVEGKGVAESVARAELSVNPNPAVDIASIKLSSGFGGKLEIEIYDLAGERVMNFTREFFNGGDATINWNLTDYSGSRISPGVYVIKYKTGSQRGVAKLVVVK